MTTVGRQEMQPKLLVPVGQRRRELVRPVDATAVGHHDHLFAGVAKERHHLMDILAQPLCFKLGNDLVEDFGGAILDCPNDTEQHAAGDTAPRAIADSRLAFEGLVAGDLTPAHGAGEQACALRFVPPARSGQGKAPQDRFVGLEQDELAPTSWVCESRELARGRGEGRRGGIKATGGAVGASIFF